MSEQSASLAALRNEAAAKWRALAPRERRMASVMAWCVGLTLVFMIGVRPAWRTLQQAPAQLREANAALEDMTRQANEVKMLRQMPAVPTSQAEAALQTATERLGEGARLRLQPDRAVVLLTRVPGARLVAWLAEVRAGARARPIEANIAQVEPGVYSGSISVVLTGAPAASR